MKNRPLSQHFNKEYFIFLLPLFFVLHVYTEYFPAIPITEAIKMLATQLLIALALAIVCSLLFRSWHKGVLTAFALIILNLFFGAFHDTLKRWIPGTFIVKYTFLVPLIIVLVLILILWLRKKNIIVSKATRFLNVLLVLLIIIDVISIAIKPRGKELSLKTNDKPLIKCDTCNKPDIYLIVLDEYAGKKELKDVFGFDNSPFLNELSGKGFHVIDNSVSNYNATVFSMASMLNLNYLENADSTKINLKQMLMCRKMIQENEVTKYLKLNGYSIYNNSFFELDDKDRLVKNAFFPTYQSLFISQTFIQRIRHDLGANFASNEQLSRTRKNNYYNDQLIYNKAKENVTEAGKAPKFVYSHFMMPHHPYFTDSSGKEVELEKLTDSYSANKQAYLEYLIYTNKKIIQFVDYIISHSQKPPVVLLLSDHGWRQFTGKTDNSYYFMNLNAVFLPGQDYNGLYDGISNVNEFRVILNHLFHQDLPLLKDASTFLYE